MRHGIQVFTLLLLTTILANADSPVSDAPNNQKRSAIAESDSGWLVVWEDQRIHPAPDVWGQLIDRDGSLRDSNFPICTASVKECCPAIEWYDTCYLITWEEDQGGTVSHVYGRFLDWTGSSARPAFPIAEAANSVHPNINSSENHWLVAWADYRNGTDLNVYGQLLDRNGNLVGLPIPISEAADQQSHVVAAWNGVHWLATWEDKRGGNSDIYGQLIDATGGLVGANFTICQADGNQQYPEIVRAGSDWLVAWSDYRSGSCYDIYGVAIDPSGSPKSPELPIAVDPSRNSYYPAVTWCEPRNWFVVVWADYQTSSRILRRNVDTLWNLTATYLMSSSPSNAWYPAISGDGADCIVVWEDDRNGNWDIYSYTFDPVGVHEKAESQKLKAERLHIHPNPFTTKTSIRFELSTVDHGPWTLAIYDLGGRLVRSFPFNRLTIQPFSSEGGSASGGNQATWDGKDNNGQNVQPGIYFVRLTAGSKTTAKKLVFVR